MLGFPLGILSAAGAAVGQVGAYELISTTVLGGTASSVTFSSLGDYSSTYKHLQIRATHLWTGLGGATDLVVRLNGDTAGNYNNHGLVGNGSSVVSIAAANTTHARIGFIASGQFGSSVTNILDAYSTTKNKTTMTLVGARADVNEVQLTSGAWRDTASITSVTILPTSLNLATGSRFSLYGIKG
jgi:hypothetical protein